MASVYRKGNLYTLQRAVNGRRVWMSLGKATKAFLRAVKLHVAQIEQAQLEGGAVPADSLAWLAGLGAKLRDGFTRVGLANARAGAKPLIPTTIGKLFDEYLDRRTDLLKNSRANIRAAKVALIAGMGGTKLAGDIRPVDAADWRQWLIGQDYSGATVSAFVKKAKQVFADAVAREILGANPFAKLVAGKQSNPERMRDIDRPTIARVMEECDWRWKLIVALVRFGGLRCPSEVYDLRWDGVLFDKSRIVVWSRKTARAGKPKRVIPMFPELRGPLAEALRQRQGDDSRVVAWWHSLYNPHTQFERIVERAGLAPWPRLFHNLRASRQTELANSFPGHVVAAWMGNTEKIAAEHYLSVTDEHFERAANRAAGEGEMTRIAAQNATDGRVGSFGPIDIPEISADVRYSRGEQNLTRKRGRNRRARGPVVANRAATPDQRFRRTVERSHQQVIQAGVRRQLELDAEQHLRPTPPARSEEKCP